MLGKVVLCYLEDVDDSIVNKLWKIILKVVATSGIVSQESQISFEDFRSCEALNFLLITALLTIHWINPDTEAVRSVALRNKSPQVHRESSSTQIGPFHQTHQRK